MKLAFFGGGDFSDNTSIDKKILDLLKHPDFQDTLQILWVNA